jgi:hypothetical protein
VNSMTSASARPSETLESVVALALLWLIPVVAFILAMFLG